jgi:hypothetical protein
LQGLKGGVEVSANITKVVIILDQSRSTPMTTLEKNP